VNLTRALESIIALAMHYISRTHCNSKDTRQEND
jgi:hypothetical protein